VYTLQSQLFINAFEIIRPLLDGNHSVEKITSAGGSTLLPTTIIFLLKILRANGLLQEGDISLLPPLEAKVISQNKGQLDYFSQFTPDSQNVLTSLLQARVGLVGSKKLKACIQNSIKSMGITQIEDIDSIFIEPEKLEKDKKKLGKASQGLDILIACQESEGFGFFKDINELCLETQTRWLRVAVEGTTVLLGPTFVPHQTACYACYDRRLVSNMPDFEDYEAYKREKKSNNETAHDAFFAPLWSLTASHAAIEVARTISGFAPPKTMGRFYIMEAMSPTLVGHDVVRLPRCPACNPSRPRNQAWDECQLPNEKY
jgi:bacteriocin biosynthesis cyclodehydratase domain-containing protein